jgi:dihydroorotate dehydrogenase electron transfer subunit
MGRPRGTFTGEVIANRVMCDEHYLVSLALESFPGSEPGQFVQIQCGPVGDETSSREVACSGDRPPEFTGSELSARVPLLRRPFSLAGRSKTEDGRDLLEIIYRAIGSGTRWLAKVEPGEQVSVLGPLGNTFPIDPQRDIGVMVAGGVGIPPMLYLTDALTAAGKQGVAFCGVQSANLLPLTLEPGVRISSDVAPTRCAEEFARYDVDTVIATDDGSLGFPGFISDAFAEWLEQHVDLSRRMMVYSCGPEELMRTVGELCTSRDIPSQLALERHMACGMGTCQSCIVKIRDDTSQGWSYKLCCTDGPIFDAAQVVWS